MQRPPRRLTIVACSLLLWPVLPVAAAVPDESVEDIPYRYVTSDGPSTRMRNGATVYKDKPRGEFDDEPMTEITPRFTAKPPPEPMVIPYAPLEDIEQGLVTDLRRKELKGEDKIFRQIARDVIKARCFLLGQDCDKDPDIEEKRREMLYPPAPPPPAP
ncbi:hypothetical protein [Marinobacterium arenosum]|uniref:hypothetical protein n=1 Tax=Marinobacterium arenosum TaxID=2862496 RepID=UPI001C9471E3|nr:hypothetical protein [Marinobacterium arenosum]MBY4677966.1 hypothetical protein [Marinobacterium arenosum]